MIYLIGGAPRTGKTILAQRMAARLGIGWMSTDLLVDLLRVAAVPGIQSEWDAAPGAITAAAEWFFPYLERFVGGVAYLADGFVVEGVGFLPHHVARLSDKCAIRSLFLGCSTMTIERLDRFPGRSAGYASLPEAMRLQIARDVPRWSRFIRREAQRFDCPYLDMGDNFPQRLMEAEAALLTTVNERSVGGKGTKER
ncbi:MAG: hypothetical protein R3272_05945 [Candidatus Promineifilaceae bacterium]|nr:hypothetical protein [Candidatus Promineifilaceae bacterium]